MHVWVLTEECGYDVGDIVRGAYSSPDDAIAAIEAERTRKAAGHLPSTRHRLHPITWTEHPDEWDISDNYSQGSLNFCDQYRLQRFRVDGPL